MKDGRVVAVGKRQRAKLNLPAHGVGYGLRIAVAYLGFDVHYLVDAAYGYECALEAIDYPCRVHDWADELGQVGVEGDKGSQRKTALNNGFSSQPQVDAQTHGGDQVRQGAIRSTRLDKPAIFLQILVVELAERLVLSSALHIGFDDARSEVFLDVVAHLAKEILYGAKPVVNQRSHAR